jgi:glucosamine--fructose-6-phosphate aminotransferase (isomerizing)
VVNTNPSPIADVATMVIDTGNIPDSYASTVGYTSTVAALGIIADGWGGGTIGPGWRNLPDEFVSAERSLTDQVSRLGSIFAQVHSADFVGAGPSVGSAEAAALLFREVARLPSTGMGTRQYLHGAMESAGNTAHVLFGDSRETEVAATLAAAGHPVILVTAEPVESCRNLAVVQIPRRPPGERVILEALVMQILAAAAAAERAVDIDEFVFHHSDTKVPASASRSPDPAVPAASSPGPKAPAVTGTSAAAGTMPG